MTTTTGAAPMSAAEVLATIDRLAELERDIRSGSSSKVYRDIGELRTAVAAMAEREAALVAKINRLEQANIEYSERVANLMGRAGNAEENNSALVKEVEALRADRDRLNWLDANNVPKRMGWAVGIAPAGNVSVSSVVFLGSEPVTIRGAIDAARAEARDV